MSVWTKTKQLVFAGLFSTVLISELAIDQPNHPAMLAITTSPCTTIESIQTFAISGEVCNEQNKPQVTWWSWLTTNQLSPQYFLDLIELLKK